MADLQTKFEEFQNLYQEALERLESLETAKIEDKMMIDQLKAENERLKPGS